MVQSLRHHDEGPLELTRRQKVLVWDDEVEVADDTMQEIFVGPLSASPKPSVRTLPIQPTSHRRSRSSSALEPRGFPPPLHRTSSDTRPVPFVSTLPRVHPGTTGVTVLEHMERVDAVEAGLRRLQVDDNVIHEEDEEVDVGVAVASPSSRPSTIREVDTDGERSATPSARISPPISPTDATFDHAKPTGQDSLASSMTEEDLVAMSQSTSALEAGRQPTHPRFNSHEGTNSSARPANLDWIREEELVEERKRIMIQEVSFHVYDNFIPG